MALKQFNWIQSLLIGQRVVVAVAHAPVRPAPAQLFPVKFLARLKVAVLGLLALVVVPMWLVVVVVPSLEQLAIFVILPGAPGQDQVALGRLTVLDLPIKPVARLVVNVSGLVPVALAKVRLHHVVPLALSLPVKLRVVALGLPVALVTRLTIRQSSRL